MAVYAPGHDMVAPNLQCSRNVATRRVASRKGAHVLAVTKDPCACAMCRTHMGAISVIENRDETLQTQRNCAV